MTTRPGGGGEGEETTTHHLPPASRATAHGVDSGWNDEAEGTMTQGSNEEMGDRMMATDNDATVGEVRGQ